MNQTQAPKAAELLKRYGIRPQHRLGQNFLDDPAALQSIVNIADITPADTVLEIGCGLGHLTQYLAAAAQRVVAVEVDERLASIASRSLKACTNVRVVPGDILTLPAAILDLPSSYVVAANIPYNITSPIIRHLVESEPKPRRIVLTVQEEVAERICAQPPKMSILTLSVQVYGAVEIAARIPAAAFFPVPRVDSAVVRVDVRPQPLIPGPLLPTFFALVRLAFAQKRKTLRNNLAAGLHVAPARAAEVLQVSGIDPQLRAEALGFDEWNALCNSSEIRSLLGPAV